MKILYVVDYYQPQLGYGSYYIPKELTKLGHQVSIFTSNHYYPFPHYEETAGKILGKREIKSGITRADGVTIIRNEMKYEIFTRAIFGGHEEFIRSFNPDVVIVDKTAGYNQIVISRLKSKYYYKLISLDAHLPSGFKAEGNQAMKKLFYFLFRLLFSNLINKTTDKFIAVQEDTAEIMKKYYGISGRIEHIPLGTDTDLFKYNPMKGSRIRKIYGIYQNDFVIIYTGKVIKEKGVDILFAAFNILSKSYKNIILFIVGSGSKEYINFCKSRLDRKYMSNVVWTGFKQAKDLFKYYSASDVGAWPLQESMSMNDAAACSLPFIANHTIGAKLRLSNRNAILYKKGNAKDLAKKIEFLYKNSEKRKAMGGRGRELMEKKFSWRKIAEDYIKEL